MNDENLTAPPIRTSEEAARIGRLGGLASGESRRRKKTIAEALRKVLDEPVGEGGATRLDAITRNALQNLYKAPSMKGLKILAEILGELDVNLNLAGDGGEMGIRIVDTRKPKAPEQK